MNLPIYLLKYIIRIACNYINKISNDYSFKKNEICQLKKSISLTCWTFFKTMSLNLSVLIICNQTNGNQEIKKVSRILDSSNEKQKYQLLKRENITSIGFIYHYIFNNFTDLASLNQEIQLFENLNKIVIDRCDLNVIKQIEFGNIKIQDYYFSNHSTNIPFSLATNVKEIANLSIAPNNLSNLIIDFFMKGDIKVKRILEIDYHSPCQIPFEELLPSKALTCVKNYDLLILTIKDLYYLLKNSPNIKRLSFYICFDNLIYQFTNKKTLPCKCSGVNDDADGGTNINDQYFDQTWENNNSDDEVIDQFKFYWDFISNEIKNHKKLSFLKIVNKCLINYDSGSNYQKESSFPEEFIEKFSYPFKMNNSIKTVVFNGFHTPEIYEKIIINGNKSIFNYHSEFLDNTFQKKIEYKESIENLLSKNHHIKYFSLKDNNNYLLNYSKKIIK
ncbi:hypothetical protein DDB_G0286245 [Dictyostelium discoideum AX4]|uniref:Uncharacterized protein n=1 Tax=Dictyostelium discoideum TaxID=44689 RepID=Q54M26_DICDI|nr:hypothetical protein DDB_G0286245 [Dictyostelium discoideum AX4]EAL64298.1 hypothetical protein DDB_G0286245 [Dictyostelium discoideum AX4]|eukprot:XP_637805.1 hypothetical protein DDB_G0286245 [Dictyostelium discoideum AX4]